MRDCDQELAVQEGKQVFEHLDLLPKPLQDNLVRAAGMEGILEQSPEATQEAAPEQSLEQKRQPSM